MRLTAFAPGSGPAAEPQPGCIPVTDDLDYDAFVAPIMAMTLAEAETYQKESGYCYEFSWDRVFRYKDEGGKTGFVEHWCAAPPEGTITGVWGGGRNVRL